MTAIEIKNLVKKYGKTAVVDNLNLSIKENMVYGLLGENGAGKTTTLGMLSGLVRPTSGRIVVLGHDIEKDFHKVKGLVGVSLQDSSFYDNRTGMDNLLYYARLQGIEGEEEVIKVLKKVGLLGNKDMKVREYSHGMVEMLSMAQALIGDPKVLILDEPTAGFDPKVKRNIRKLIKSLRGKMILISSHDIKTVEETCDYVGILKRGKLVLEGKLSALTKKKGLEDVFIKAIG